ncbi:MAG: hypothetical protein PUH86_11515 [Lachnospiraceae bacterium]|nr:hypothetical protein [Lachnospiraceae bacterium]
MGNTEREKKYDGYVMQIQNFSVNDGEGIRTTIFLAVCLLPVKSDLIKYPRRRHFLQQG